MGRFQSKLSEEQKTELVGAAAAGTKRLVLADRFQIGRATVQRILKESRTPAGPKLLSNQPVKRKRRKLTEEQVAEITHALKIGTKRIALAYLYHVHVSTIDEIARSLKSEGRENEQVTG